ncbi:MAG: methionyl-tRNA formyltransferase [Steroidobacteraceae bacterium]
MKSLRLGFAGTPQFALPSLAALLASVHQVIGVLTQPDRPAGRGQRTAPSPVRALAQSHGVPVATPVTLRDAAVESLLDGWQLDALIVVAYGLLLPPAILALPRAGCINVHASLLPRWRGAAPIQWALLEGDVATGVTIMQMDAGLDTGPILARRELAIGARETAPELGARLAAQGGELLLGALARLAAGTLAGQPQPDLGVTYARKLNKKDARVDFRRSAVEIDRKVRALCPWPGTEASLGGELLRIHASRLRPETAQPAARPGAVLEFADDALWVRCGEGELGITRMQRPGRRAVSARDFVNSERVLGGQFDV